MHLLWQSRLSWFYTFAISSLETLQFYCPLLNTNHTESLPTKRAKGCLSFPAVALDSNLSTLACIYISKLSRARELLQNTRMHLSVLLFLSVFSGLPQKALKNSSRWQFQKGTIPKRQYGCNFWFWRVWMFWYGWIINTECQRIIPLDFSQV